MNTLKKIVAAGLAAASMVSAMSISAFAAESDVFATVTDNDGNVTYIYDSDLVDGRYTVTINGETATFEEREMSEECVIMPATLTGEFTRKTIPVSSLNLAETSILDFDLPIQTSARYSPYKYYSSSGEVDFAYTVTSGGNSNVYGYVKTTENLYTMNLTGTKLHAVTVDGCKDSSTAAYAYVQNPSKKSQEVIGYCTIRPM